MKRAPRLRGLAVACALSAWAPALASTPLGPAQVGVAQELVPVEGLVTSVAGNSVFVDLGRDQKVDVGDRAVLYPPGVARVEGTLRAVARSSARIELDPSPVVVRPGTRVEVLVPRARVTPPAPAGAAPAETPAEPPPATPAVPGVQVPPQRPQPVHPPWTHPPESWATDQPLLAPAFGLRPDERPTDLHGSTWLDFRHSTDSAQGTRRSFFGRAGAAVRVTNPFGSGGELELDAELLQQSFTFPDAPSADETDFVLRRLSYVHGGTVDEPTRLQVGRFLAYEFPGLGVLDGVEWTRRTEGGSRFGVNAGGLPEPFPDANTFEDYGVALFGRWVSDEEERVRLGAALQNTWHAGEQDRTLLLAEAEWQPSRRFWWRNAAWVDAYDSSDELKGSGLELTEVSSHVRWQVADAWGLGAGVSRRRWPELLRREFASVSPELIQDGELDRGSLSAWHDLSARARLDARVDAWSDQDDDGTNAEVGIALRDLLYEHGSVTLAVFRADGSYSSGEGVRASVSRSWDRTFGQLSYELASGIL